MNLVIAFLLLKFLSTTRGQEITSVGQHSNEEFLWTVDVDRLSFNISFTGFTSSNFITYTYDWLHVSADNKTLVSFRTQIASSSLNAVSCYNGTNRSNPPNASVNGINYRIDCEIVGSRMESQFTIVSPMSSFYNNSAVEVAQVAFDFRTTKYLKLGYCVTLTSSDHLQISGGAKAGYGSIATYTCSDSALVVNGTYDKNINTYSRTCNYDMKWTDQGSHVACWFAPEVNITIKQNGAISNEILVSEDVCTLNCTISAPGNPVQSFATYFKNGAQISNTFTVTSGDNGARIFCQRSNSYVNDVDSSAGISRSIILDVLFQPERLNGDPSKKQYARIGEDYTMIISFSANPWVYIPNTALYFDGKLLNTSNASISYSGTRHEYRYPIMNVGEKNFGTYVLSARSPNPELAGRASNFTVVLNSTEPFSTTTIPQSTSLSIESDGGLSTAAVAAISTCVGIVLTIIATSAVWWWVLKRISKESMNDEKKESAYEPTYVDGQPLESAYEVVNRETIEDNMRGATREQTNVNSAYEVIR